MLKRELAGAEIFIVANNLPAVPVDPPYSCVMKEMFVTNYVLKLLLQVSKSDSSFPSCCFPSHFLCLFQAEEEQRTCSCSSLSVQD